MDFDLLEVRKVVDDTYQLAKEVVEGANHTGIVRQLWYRLFIICKDNLKRWTVMHNIFTGNAELPSNPERSRNNRFAAAAAVLLSSLAAGIAGDLSGHHQTREDLLRMADQQNRMIVVLKKDKIRLNMEADHQHEIEQILGSV